MRLEMHVIPKPRFEVFLLVNGQICEIYCNLFLTQLKPDRSLNGATMNVYFLEQSLEINLI